MSVLDTDNHGLTPEEIENVIPCIGVDNLYHVCVSWKDETLCGIPVKRKCYDDQIRCSCYYCTY